MSIADGIRAKFQKRGIVAKRDNYTSINPDNESKKVDCENAICPPRQLTEVLIEQARELQMLPDVAVKAIAVANDPDAQINSLVNIIGQDVKLTTDILALSNSALFGFGQSLCSLQHAITRIGFRQTKNMILASSFASMLTKMKWQEIRIRDLLCKHSFLTGIISSKVNSLLGLGMQGEEFTAGLVHDVGRTLLAVTIPDEFEQFDAMDFNETPAVLEREHASIGTTHTEVGAWFLQRNHLPEELVTVALHHHTPEQASKFKRLVATVSTAMNMANYAQRDDNEQPYQCDEEPGAMILESLGTEGAIEKLNDAASVIMERSLEEVDQLVGMRG